MKNRMKAFKEKIQKSHLCPYCHESIGFVRKFFCYNGWHFKPCPHCNRKIKVKTLSPILAAIYALLAITVISSVFLREIFGCSCFPCFCFSLPFWASSYSRSSRWIPMMIKKLNKLDMFQE